MSAEERIELEDKLTKGLKESFEKMLHRKRQLNESVVNCDENGNVITLTAEEAWRLYERDKKTSKKLIGLSTLNVVFIMKARSTSSPSSNPKSKPANSHKFNYAL